MPWLNLRTPAATWTASIPFIPGFDETGFDPTGFNIGEIDWVSTEQPESNWTNQ